MRGRFFIVWQRLSNIRTATEDIYLSAPWSLLALLQLEQIGVFVLPKAAHPGHSGRHIL